MGRNYDAGFNMGRNYDAGFDMGGWNPYGYQQQPYFGGYNPYRYQQQPYFAADNPYGYQQQPGAAYNNGSFGNQMPFFYDPSFWSNMFSQMYQNYNPTQKLEQQPTQQPPSNPVTSIPTPGQQAPTTGSQAPNNGPTVTTTTPSAVFGKIGANLNSGKSISKKAEDRLNKAGYTDEQIIQASANGADQATFQQNLLNTRNAKNKPISGIGV